MKNIVFLLVLALLTSCDYFTRTSMKIHPFSEGEYDGNYLEYINEEIEDDEDNPYLYFLKSRFLLENNRLEEANTAINQSLVLDSSNVEYLKQKCFIEYEKGSYKKAVRFGEKAREGGGKELELYEKMVFAHNQLNNTIQADLYTKRIKNIAPDYPRLDFLIGMNYLNVSDTLDAIFYLKKAAKDQGYDEEVFGNLIQLLVKTKRVEEAKNYLDIALEKSPDNPDLVLQYANTQKQKGDNQEYELWMKKAFQTDTTRLDIAKELVDYYIDKGQRYTATSFAEELDSATFAKNKDYFNMMGDVYYARYINSKSEKYYNYSLQIDSTQSYVDDQLKKIASRRRQIYLAQQDTLTKSSNFVEREAADRVKKDTTKNKLFKVW